MWKKIERRGLSVERLGFLMGEDFSRLKEFKRINLKRIFGSEI